MRARKTVATFLAFFAFFSAKATFSQTSQADMASDTATIDWQAAKADFASPEDVKALQNFRAAAVENLDQYDLPVLAVVPKDPTRGAPVIDPPGDDWNSYNAVYTLPGAQVAIYATRNERPATGDAELEKDVASAEDINFEFSEGSADLNFKKYGAAYFIRVQCDKVEDERCTKRDFLDSMYKNLSVVGGSGL